MGDNNTIKVGQVPSQLKESGGQAETLFHRPGDYVYRMLAASVPFNIAAMSSKNGIGLGPNKIFMPTGIEQYPSVLSFPNAVWIFIAAAVMHNFLYQARRYSLNPKLAQSENVPGLGVLAAQSLGVLAGFGEFFVGTGGVLIPTVAVSESLTRIGISGNINTLLAALTFLYTANTIWLSKDMKTLIKNAALPVSIILKILGKLMPEQFKKTKENSIKGFEEQQARSAQLREDLAKTSDQNPTSLFYSGLPAVMEKLEQSIGEYQKAAEQYKHDTTSKSSQSPGQVRQNYEAAGGEFQEFFKVQVQELAQAYQIPFSKACQTLSDYLKKKYVSQGAWAYTLFECN